MAKFVDGKVGKALGILAAFLGIGFFSAALERFLGWDVSKSGWKSGGLTLGATLVSWVGLRALGFHGAANAALIGGLAMTGVDFLARPVDDAGAKFGSWMRSFGGQGGASGPKLTQSEQAGYTPPSTGFEFSGATPTGMGPAAMNPAVTGTQPSGPAPAAAQPAAAPVYQITYEAAKVPKPDTLTTITGQVLAAGSSILGAYLGGGSKGDARSRMALGRIG